MTEASPLRRRQVIDALRRGTVPQRGLDVLAVGTEQVAGVLDDELGVVAGGAGGFKAIRGEYGSGKTFLVRWLAERARRQGFATSEVQISEGETPLHHLETVYRRAVERLSTAQEAGGALRGVVDGWFYALEEDAIAAGAPADDPAALSVAVPELLDRRLTEVSRRAPAFAAVLRAYRTADAAGEAAIAEGLLAWLGGQPHVAAAVKRSAGVKGEVDHDRALAFLGGLLVVLRDAGRPGLVLVLDEVETLQRVRGDVRERALNALRQLLDEVDAGRFPGLYLVITGTPAFFDGPQGVQRLPPLAQRLHTDFATNARFDNPRAPQIRLRGFDLDGLTELGVRVRDLYAGGGDHGDRVLERCDDAYVGDLAATLVGEFAGRVGLVPRVFLKVLIGEVLDRVDLFADFDPRRDHRLALADSSLTEVERNARRATTVDDIDLDLG